MKPFVKWVGGKTQLLDVLDVVIPKDFVNYYEPFLGGGAVFLHLKPKNAFISDINKDLILSWIMIKNNYQGIINILKNYLNEGSLEQTYYQIRDDDLTTYREVQRVARFIFLNKTCFNGLYRVNKKGNFNVPFNKKANINLNTLIDIKNSKNIHLYLNENNICILNTSYEEMIQKANKNDFIFVDPPYDSDTYSFDSYSPQSFGKDGQNKLCLLLKEANKRGVKWVLTNHDTNLINNLYQDFNFYRIPVNRFINSNGNNRKNATFETIVTNYELSEQQKQTLSNKIFFKELKSTSYFLQEYVNWSKINDFINKNTSDIGLLSNLISDNEEHFSKQLKSIYEENKEKCLSLLPNLIANNSDKNNLIFLDKEEKEIIFDIADSENVFDFIKESGLLENLFLNSNRIKIEDYLFGLHVGLSSHDKKNKSGKFLPNLIEKELKMQNIEFKKEVSLKEILKHAVLEEKKILDFVFKVKNITFLLECSFFNVSGSKINSELSRMIALSDTINKFENYKLIYVIDGIGFKRNQTKTIEALQKIKYMFNLKRFKEFIEKLKK